MLGHTILLVEDETSLRTVVRLMLEQHGHTVIEADNGVDALFLATQHLGPIHLLFTDVDMSPMSGPELAEQILMSRPEIPILFTSGRRKEESVLEDLRRVNSFFLPKPFNPKVMEEAVEHALISSVA